MTLNSTIQAAHEDLVIYVLKARNRQRIADLSGLHLNTVADIISGKRPNPTVQTLIKLELAVAQIKANKDLTNGWGRSNGDTWASNRGEI